ncbi:AAA family ATPase [Dorea sp. AGR2135]|uniref:AAA family ATPase n=1 Tax=Dorea sp. AGR2135 TaxID=1280669 RepID=UPI00041C5ED6|nr:ATP-binding protein [Dorea sp. AGR2135]
MANINSIEINQFRGIRQLTISNFSKINLIVGDNNSGKTTFLEAVQLLFAKSQLSSVKKIIKQRTVLNVSESSFYTSFIKMFNVNQESELLDFDIYAVSNNGPIRFEMRGRERTISGEEALQMSTMSLGQKAHYKKESTVVPETAKLFSGSIISQNGKKPIEKDIHFTSLDNVSVGPVIKREVQYIPSFGHLRYDLLKNFVDNPEYKKLAISILKQFDDSIVDICYTKADDGCFLESIITADGINMPFSVYGDGVKKILYILNKLFDATDSILLIDEIETGLHKKYYDRLFPVVFELAKKLNVQLFIATHSMEAIDAILSYGNYENDSNDTEPIRVITLKKVYSNDDKGSNVVARNVAGKYVYDNRKAFEFEVRL